MFATLPLTALSSRQVLGVLVSAVAVADRAEDHGDHLVVRAPGSTLPFPSAIDHGPAQQPGEQRPSLILI